MAFEIHKVRIRAALTARREPYWASPIEPGRFVGFRQIDDQRGSWIARARDREDGKQCYEALGSSLTMEYDGAVAAARRWFKSLDQGVSNEPITVAKACRLYVEAKKGTPSGRDSETRFERTVYDTDFGKTVLQVHKITKQAIKGWRDALPGTKSNANRTMAVLRAALNMAVEDRAVSADVAREWKEVKQHPKADGRRELFLDLQQRKALLNAATGSIRDLIEAALTTGARPGELIGAKRSQFDARTRTMTFSGKTGPRTKPLMPAAVTLFERLSKDKQPAAYLFTRADGMPWTHGGWAEEVRDAATAAKLPDGTCLYTLRHSFITQCLMDSMGVLDVANQVGTSIQMIQEHYGQHVPGAVQKKLARVRMI